MATLVSFLRIAIAIVFALAAVAKLSDLGAWQTSLRNQRIGSVQARILSKGIPTLELGVASLLVIPSTWKVGAWAAVTLLVGFSAHLAFATTRVDPSNCGCFGKYWKPSSFRSLLLRNAILLIASAAVAVYAAS